ncbi:hypothetical protein ACK3SF_04605 [Candidatus Nanosalina sp. VS9-1]|uniref:hypothetical protein n=1 Tax=Candidatus Nanosalina sp. VS9-1 TaxID=3388566 RepID=UPI0039DFBF0E
MSDSKDHPGFGYVFKTSNGSPWEKAVRSGKIETLEDVRSDDGPGSIKGLMGEQWKSIKVKSNTRGGVPYGMVINSVDKFADDLNYTAEKVEESVYVSPDSQLHNQLMQQHQNAEQRVKETKRNLSELLKQKHMLEHDIRKLRSRIEDIEEGNETRIKADFVELVDGAGASGGQGGDRASLKFLRDQNLYPSIVADFNEMDSTEDLMSAEDKAKKYEDKDEEDLEDGKLAHLPANVKAILKKKYAMYEKWKDMYGSEIQRKLEELKGELKGIERAIEETEDYLEPYVRDMEMINNKSQEELASDMRRHIQLRGYSSLFTEREYIIYRGLKNTGEDIVVTDDEDEITHYRVIFLHQVHANLAGGEEPTDPKQGPSVAKVFWHPAIVDKFVFENIFKERIDEVEKDLKLKLQDYKGNIDTKKGKKLKDARHEKDMSVRELREALEEEIGEQIPLEVSSRIRRVEDGLDELDVVFNDDQLKALDEVLDTEFHEDSESGGPDFYQGIERKLKLFTGQVDKYLVDESTAWADMEHEMKFRYYYDLKIGFGLFTMK